MSHDSIFGGSVFGGVVTGADAATARPIQPGQAFYTDSQVSADPGSPLGSRGQTENLMVTKRITGAQRPVQGRPYAVGAQSPIRGTSHGAGIPYFVGASKLVPGYVRPAGQPYDVDRAKAVTATLPGAQPRVAGLAYRTGGELTVGNLKQIGGGQYAPRAYGPREQGVFHLPPRVGLQRYADPHQFGPPVIGGGAVGLAGLIGMG